uniref:Uncharacterized protein n=1 Tax=Polytomella parva TaxID=51329 RepID=A0A7S0YJ71_9CHLO|mmetsp:Transcript_29395/g.53938  ORF Transcript_29395/g.53938 Transcript_29395/m.53938 type:complete len:542 (+) Transcript_29395:80-1705(+)
MSSSRKPDVVGSLSNLNELSMEKKKKRSDSPNTPFEKELVKNIKRFKYVTTLDKEPREEIVKDDPQMFTQCEVPVMNTNAFLAQLHRERMERLSKNSANLSLNETGIFGVSKMDSHNSLSSSSLSSSITFCDDKPLVVATPRGNAKNSNENLASQRLRVLSLNVSPFAENVNSNIAIIVSRTIIDQDFPDILLLQGVSESFIVELQSCSPWWPLYGTAMPPILSNNLSNSSDILLKGCQKDFSRSPLDIECIDISDDDSEDVLIEEVVKGNNNRNHETKNEEFSENMKEKMPQSAACIAVTLCKRSSFNGGTLERCIIHHCVYYPLNLDLGNSFGAKKLDLLRPGAGILKTTLKIMIRHFTPSSHKSLKSPSSSSFSCSYSSTPVPSNPNAESGPSACRGGGSCRTSTHEIHVYNVSFDHFKPSPGTSSHILDLCRKDLATAAAEWIQRQEDSPFDKEKKELETNKQIKQTYGESKTIVVISGDLGFLNPLSISSSRPVFQDATVKSQCNQNVSNFQESNFSFFNASPIATSNPIDKSALF